MEFGAWRIHAYLLSTISGVPRKDGVWGLGAVKSGELQDYLLLCY